MIKIIQKVVWDDKIFYPGRPVHVERENEKAIFLVNRVFEEKLYLIDYCDREILVVPDDLLRFIKLTPLGD